MSSGTVTPLGNIDVRGVVHALVNPANNEEYLKNQAFLTECFKEPGLFLELQNVAADRNIPRNERLFASVVTSRELKNKWRSKLMVPEARKPEVRERLLGFLEEEDTQIARPQLALLVAVARIELPKFFPNLPQLLLNPLLTCVSHLSSGSGSSSTTTTVLLNTLWTINGLIKEWKTVKVASGAEVMKRFEEVFYGPVGQILSIWTERQQIGQVDWVIEEAGRYAFKILARFSSWHWSKAKGLQSEAAISNIQMLVQHSVNLAPVVQSRRLRIISRLSLDHSEQTDRQLRALIKHLRSIGKWWRVMIGMDPKGFCNLEGATAGVGWWWGEVGGVVAGSDGAVAEDDSDLVPHPKRFLLLGMLLFKDILPILSFNHPNIFTPDFILSALHLLVDKLLPLTSSDLEALESDPEEWLNQESNDEEAWAFEFRPCAERVLIALSNACRALPDNQKIIEPELIKMLAEVEAIPPIDLPTILRREAVYCAVGRLARALLKYGSLDFNHFLQGVSSWIAQPLPILRILKRRLAWTLGEWASVDAEHMPTENGQSMDTPSATCVKQALLWQIFIHLLTERGEATDAAVQLTVTNAIKSCVDLWDVDIDYFLPHLQPVAQGLIALLGEAETLNGKRVVNQAVIVVIDRSGDKILPYLPDLARAIPGLWNGAGGMDGEWLFKASLVVLTQKLVTAAKESSGGLMDLVLPLIQESLVPPAKDFFEEDGLALWQTSLYNTVSAYTPTPDKSLIQLLSGLLGLVASNMDLLDVLLNLLDSYLLLDARGIIESRGNEVCQAISQALTASKTNPKSLRRILSTISLLVRTTPLNLLAPHLIEAGIFQHITFALEDDKASGLILAAYLEILSRIILADAQGFLHIATESARVQQRDAHRTLEEILDAFWRNFDYVAEPRMRKAVAMAAGALLTTGHTQCLERLDGEFMNIFLDVLGESRESVDEATGAETSVKPWKDEHQEAWADIDGTLEGQRRSALEDNDPASALALKTYVIDALTRAQGVGLGPYWDKADQGTKQSLEKFLS